MNVNVEFEKLFIFIVRIEVVKFFGCLAPVLLIVEISNIDCFKILNTRLTFEV